MIDEIAAFLKENTVGKEQAVAILILVKMEELVYISLVCVLFEISRNCLLILVFFLPRFTNIQNQFVSVQKILLVATVNQELYKAMSTKT